jgi:hypothetical protein
MPKGDDECDPFGKGKKRCTVVRLAPVTVTLVTIISPPMSIESSQEISASSIEETFVDAKDTSSEISSQAISESQETLDATSISLKSHTRTESSSLRTPTATLHLDLFNNFSSRAATDDVGYQANSLNGNTLDALIVCGILALLCMAIALFYLIWRRRRNSGVQVDVEMKRSESNNVIKPQEYLPNATARENEVSMLSESTSMQDLTDHSKDDANDYKNGSIDDAVVEDSNSQQHSLPLNYCQGDQIQNFIQPQSLSCKHAPLRPSPLRSVLSRTSLSSSAS